MAKANKYLSQLQGLEGAVVEEYNPFNYVLRSPSPSLNFTFGKGHGLPFGFTAIMWGPPGGGKSLLSNAFVGQLHSDDPDAIAIKFDTEFREQGQLTKEAAQAWGIDKNRYVCYSVNSPTLVFDRIETEIGAMCQDGAPIKLIVIDSITGIQGRRELDSTTIDKQQIGDHALTLQTGLKRILPTIRKHKIALILTAHQRAEMDRVEIMRHNVTKMAASLGVKHMAEYFLLVEANRNKDGRTDLMGNEFIDDSVRDLNDKGDKTGHKISVCMTKSSMGTAGRWGEFTIDYNKGIVNVHEEVFLLGVNRGIIEKASASTYVFRDVKWVGKQHVIAALKESTSLQEEVLKELRKREAAGVFETEDTKATE